ncbi:hypothetical protein [Natronomonas pharaonis]|uniref:hypothetical protein n=1 Tax=Natronomonas pharaonis TaxID=2257 RepID=UPI000677D3C3|nr:hypothetical protein [Natronomonas pharaonis]
MRVGAGIKPPFSVGLPISVPRAVVRAQSKRWAEHGGNAAVVVESLGAEWQSPAVERDVTGVFCRLDGEP